MVALAMPQPVIAAVNGPCIGAGLGLAVSCDVRFASQTAYFSTIFSRRGLIAEFALAWSLPRLIGRGAASDLLLSGRRVSATEALQIGLVSEILSADALLQHAIDYAHDIAENVSPRSARVIKAQLRAAEGETLPEALATADEALQGSLASADFREGMAALRERRPPAFPSP